MTILVTEASAGARELEAAAGPRRDIDFHHKDVPTFIARFVGVAWARKEQRLRVGTAKAGHDGRSNVDRDRFHKFQSFGK
jgi:hypothetical protein